MTRWVRGTDSVEKDIRGRERRRGFGSRSRLG
jgi:hypothetical protein